MADESFLGWPFFEERHRSRAAELEFFAQDTWQVRDDLTHTPLPWRGDVILFLAKHTGQNHGQHFRAAAESF